ncbi:MAG TPA: biotin--[acetyl-CoA-carboxylase] ligase [Candidatus Nitrosotalea sp.]|nr:biotin--[acetyl-CoA-carboxylase] ligase [Candidatus Nitrosotalea sp.]
MNILRLPSVTSTQDEARDLPLWSVLVSDHQSAGRGRLDRRWVAPPGTALLASFVLPGHPLAPLAAGVAAAEACSPRVRLKWPNDLYLEERKLGGILVESHGQRCIVGVGVNLTWAPPGAAMLNLERDPLLERLCKRLEVWFASPPEAVLQVWRKLSHTLGRQVRVELGDGRSEQGLAEDVDGDGALIVSGRRISVGDVIHLRETDGETAPGTQARDEGQPWDDDAAGDGRR